MLRFMATACLALLAPAPVSAEPGDDPGDLEAWIETDPPKHGSREWGVANWSEREWVVSLREGRPRARLRAEKDDAPATLPAPIDPSSSKRRRSSLKVSDGWIVAYDGGEFGGAIRWYSPDGKDRYRIATARVRGFFETEAGLLAIEGLSHLGTSEGRILRLAKAPEGRWRSEDFVDLKHAPEVGAKAADGSLIVATTDRLLRVVPATREVEVLLDGVFWEGLYPNSMVIAPGGATYLGMRLGVAKVEAEGGGSRRVRWLLPKKASEEKKTKWPRPASPRGVPADCPQCDDLPRSMPWTSRNSRMRR